MEEPLVDCRVVLHAARVEMSFAEGVTTGGYPFPGD